MTYSDGTNNRLPLEGVILWQSVPFPLDGLDVGILRALWLPLGRPDIIIPDFPREGRSEELATMFEGELLQRFNEKIV